MEKQMRSKSYDKEFKLNAVKLHLNGKSAGQVCRDLGIPGSTFSGWVKEYKKEDGRCFSGSGKPKPGDEEFVKPQKKLADVELERDILKKAVAIFSKQK